MGQHSLDQGLSLVGYFQEYDDLIGVCTSRRMGQLTVLHKIIHLLKTKRKVQVALVFIILHHVYCPLIVQTFIKLWVTKAK